MSGMLYIVGTPIGNLGDMTYRAVETLKSVDIIACEDTRHSMILLKQYDIRKKLIAYHKNNESPSAEGIISLLSSGKNVALISDAGMPVISDPGNILTRLVRERGLEMTVVPGANAGLSALILSGFDASEFSFVGFLSETNKTRKSQLEKIKGIYHSVILYSSRYNINRDLTDMNAIMQRTVCVAGELTKIHERCVFGGLDLQISEPKGEYVIVLAPMPKPGSTESYEDMYTRLINDGMDKKDAMKLVAKECKVSKSEVYKLSIK